MQSLKRHFDFVTEELVACVVILVACALFAMLVTGCAAPAGSAAAPVTAAQQFNVTAGDVLSTADQVVVATRTLLRAGKITPDDAENVLKAAETAQQGVSVARGVAVKDGPAKGSARLRLAADALDQFANYVGVKPAGGK